MIKILLLMIYLWDGEVKVEQKYFDSLKECAAAGVQRAAVLSKESRFEEGMYGACVETKVREV